MRTTSPRSRLIAGFIVTILTLATIPTALALSVSVGDINDIDDVRDLRDDVEKELDDELDNLEDDCRSGIALDLDDEEDELQDDIERIYERAMDSASSSLDDDLRDDEEDLLDDVENGIDDLRDIGCDRFGNNSGNNYGYRYPSYSQFPFTTITPLYNGFSNFARPSCLNGFGSVYPTLLTSVPGYQSFSGNVCFPSYYGSFGGYGGYGTSSSYRYY